MVTNRSGLQAAVVVMLFISLLSSASMGFGGTSGIVSSRDLTDQNIIRGIEGLYDWDFSQAEKLFQGLIAERPKDPAGYFYLAMVSWQRLFSGFWSPELIVEYEKRIDRAISVAEEKLKNGHADSSAFFYLGGACGFKGRLQLMERKWFSSFLLALKAIDALKRCLDMDPDNKDVLLGLGIYEYYTGRLSKVLRFLSYLLIREGDKEKGLEKLHIAAREARYSSVEAKSVLLDIYLFLESRPAEARPLAEELSTRFTNNPTYRFLQGVTYIRLDMEPEYRGVVDFFQKRGKKETSEKDASIWRYYVLYLEASYDLFHAQYARARAKLDLILSGADVSLDRSRAAWPILKKGMSYDMEGRREKALACYVRILDLVPAGGSRFLAEKYIDEPAKARDPFLGY